MKQQCVSAQFIAINDNMEMVARVLNQMVGEGKRARQRRGRNRDFVRGRALQREGDGVRHKIDDKQKICGANVRLISEVIKNVANDVLPMICNFSLLIYK